MSYEVKFGFPTGYNLAFSVFQPSGIGRGFAHQFLQEVVNQGYYRATPITNLVVGDAVIVYRQEKVLYESEGVLYLDYEYVFWEDEYIAHEGEYVRDLDTESNQKVFWTEEPVGTGEYESVIESAADLTVIETKVDVTDENIDLLIVETQRVNDVYDATVKPTEIAIIRNL